MKAGDLREIVTILQREVSRDIYGAEVSTWVEFTREYVSVIDMSGREYFAAQQAQVEVTTNIRMRFIVGISALMRIERENGELFDIINVIDVEGKHKELKLLCRRFIKE